MWGITPASSIGYSIFLHQQPAGYLNLKIDRPEAEHGASPGLDPGIQGAQFIGSQMPAAVIFVITAQNG